MGGEGGGGKMKAPPPPFLAAGKVLLSSLPSCPHSPPLPGRKLDLTPPPPLQDDEGGGVELEEELLAAACDMLPALASAAGPAAYAAVFAADHLPHLLAR